MTRARGLGLKALALIFDALDLGIVALEILGNKLAYLGGRELSFSRCLLDGVLEPQHLLYYSDCEMRLVESSHLVAPARDLRGACSSACVSHALLASIGAPPVLGQPRATHIAQTLRERGWTSFGFEAMSVGGEAHAAPE